MVAVSSLLVGAAVVGAGATAYSAVQSSKAAKAQSDALDKQEDAARELAKLDQTKDSADASFEFGRQDAGATLLPGTSPVATGTGTTRANKVKNRVGWLKGSNAAIGSKLGL